MIGFRKPAISDIGQKWRAVELSGGVNFHIGVMPHNAILGGS